MTALAEKISVEEIEDTSNGWVFAVTVGEGDSATRHRVTVKEEYWEQLTEGKVEPDELVKQSFEFLLEREPRESILGEFDLPVIQKYFPEYEDEIRAERSVR